MRRTASPVGTRRAEGADLDEARRVDAQADQDVAERLVIERVRSTTSA